ncbi:MAG: hypothetical protein HY938_01085 [Nitrosomonadales bacterium]|nr:hypothetical protein [Nitrosomonadales bacterium]
MSGYSAPRFVSSGKASLVPLLLVLIGGGAAVAAYLQALDYPFVSDDITYVADNARLAGLHAGELWRLFVEPYNTMEFLPLRDLSYWFDIKFFGMNPAAFRMHNIFLYLLNLPLVYGVTSGLWRYFRLADAAGSSWAAAVVTALFALHPAHAEAVVWVSGRKDLLAGMLSMLALWFAVHAKKGSGFSHPRAAASLLALLAAMLSKATAVAAAPVIALLWVMFWRDTAAQYRRNRLLLWPSACLLLSAGAMLIFSAYSTVKFPAYYGWETASRMLAVMGWLARLAISPEGRHFFYPVLDYPGYAVMVASGAILLAAAVRGGLMILRGRSLAGFSLVVFVLFCLPYSQLMPYQTPSLVTDRFLFLGAWPAILLIVVLVWRLEGSMRWALLFAIALPWGYQTVERVRDWRSFSAVIDADVRAYPGYYVPASMKILHNFYRDEQYGEAVMRATATGVAAPEIKVVATKLVDALYAVRMPGDNPDRAMALLWDLSRILQRLPVESKWNIPLAVVWDRDAKAVERAWAALVARFPEHAALRYNAGLGLMNLRYYNEAAGHLRAALGSNGLPESVRGAAFMNLGIALINSKRIAEAESPLRAALEQAPPDMGAYCALSVVYRQTQRYSEAARADENCRKFAPARNVVSGEASR